MVFSILLNDGLVIFLDFFDWSVNARIKVECVTLDPIQVHSLLMQEWQDYDGLWVHSLNILCDIDYSVIPYRLDGGFGSDFDVAIQSKDVGVKVKYLRL